DLELTIQLLLAHARIMVPGLSVPYKVPHVCWSVFEFGVVGGFVVESDGWVRIEIHPRYRGNIRVIRAILVHELCHYILENSGLREKDRLKNERVTYLDSA